MRPVWSQETQETTKEWIDIVIALDVSGSMGADDFSPDRLSVAKQNVTDFIESITSDRVGLVVFAWQPFTSVPLTFDYEITSQIVSQLSTETIDQRVRGLNGTAIGDAIVASLWILEKWIDEDSQDREQVIILVTDGEATAWSLDPQLASAYAIEQWVTIYTVGIWSIEWGFISYDTPFGQRKQPVWGVDEAMLRSIASQTWWTYRRAVDEETFKRIFDELWALTKSEIKTETIQTSLPALQRLERVVCVGVIGLLVLVVMWYRTSWWTSSTLGRMVLCIVLLWLSVILLITKSTSQEQPTQQEISVVLDVSKSMNVQDIDYREQTVSRLQAAKTLIQRAVDRISNAKWWMQVFAGASTTVLPITSDRELFLTFLQWVDRESVIEWWSDLWSAIRQAIDRFVENNSTLRRHVLVVSDGGEDAVTLDDETLNRIQDQDIVLTIIGVWTQEWWAIIEWVDRFGNPIVMQYQWQTVIAALWEDILESIADQWWWIYRQLDDIDDIELLLQHIWSQKKVQLSSVQIHAWWTDGVLMLIILLLFMILNNGFLITFTRSCKSNRIN